MTDNRADRPSDITHIDVSERDAVNRKVSAVSAFSMPEANANLFTKTTCEIPGIDSEFFLFASYTEFHLWAHDGHFSEELVAKIRAILMSNRALGLQDFWHVDEVCRTPEDADKNITQESVGFTVSLTPSTTPDSVVNFIKSALLTG